jgi:hypothetical protein
MSVLILFSVQGLASSFTSQIHAFQRWQVRKKGKPKTLDAKIKSGGRHA